MVTDRSRRLSLDLFVADLEDANALTALVAAHAVAPARQLCRMPRPQMDESQDDVLVGPMRFNALTMQPTWPTETPRPVEFEPFLRGYVLATRLFPGAFETPDSAEEFLAMPGAELYHRAFRLANLSWSNLATMVGGLFGLQSAKLDAPGLRRDWKPQANPEAIAELHAVQALLRRSQGNAANDPDPYIRIDVGLTAMDREAAFRIDDTLRRDCHTRLVWLIDFEPAFDADGPDPETIVELSLDRGVLAALIPETITGLVVLDYVETLGLDRRAGSCALCERPVLLTGQQEARQRRAEPIYHEDCGDEHRRRYQRSYQRQRHRGTPRAAVGEG
jgi:hypothetical protein